MEFEHFVQERSASLLRVAFLLTGDRGHAEDLLQDALARTYARWDRLTDPAAAGGYVRRTMVNAHISDRRRRRLREVLHDRVPDGVGEDDRYRLGSEVGEALATLPPRMRAAVVLRYFADLSEAQTAAELGCSVGTVKSQTARGLQRLRRGLTTTAGELR